LSHRNQQHRRENRKSQKKNDLILSARTDITVNGIFDSIGDDISNAFTSVGNDIVGTAEWAESNGYSELTTAINAGLSAACTAATVICSAGCDAAKGTIEAASKTLIVATAVLDAAENVADSALNMLAGQDTFTITSFSFSLSVGPQSQSVSISMGFSFFGQDVSVSFTVDPVAVFEDLAYVVFNQIKDQLENLSLFSFLFSLNTHLIECFLGETTLPVSFDRS